MALPLKRALAISKFGVIRNPDVGHMMSNGFRRSFVITS